MAHEDLVTVASYGSPHEASIAKATLDAENIQAYLMGTEAVNTLWYIGTALGGVKLQVALRDADRATDVLGAIKSTDKSKSIAPWKCPSCGAEVDEGFEVCWSCGTSDDQQSPVAGSEHDGDLACPSTSDPLTDEREKIDAATSSSADDTAKRAWRTAVFGIVFIPLLVYSVFLILKISRQELSPAGTRQYYGALAIILTMFGLSWVLLYIIG
jgi:hypothetical protein